MASNFDNKRLLRLINERDYKNILIHKDFKIDIEKVISDINGVNIDIITSDLRYTRGKYEKYSKPDLVIYFTNSYDPQVIIKKTINEYIKESDVIIIGEKNSTKRVIKNFKVNKKFYGGDLLVSLIPKQKTELIDLEKKVLKLKIDDIKLDFKTQPGLFSYKNIDPGTKFLLENISINSNDKVLDFGCGYGVIGLFLAKKYPKSKISMVDSDLRSLNFSKVNKELNKIKNVSIHPSFLLDNVDEKFDKIISNPPTHTKLRLVEKLFKQFKKYLRRKGEIYLVINNIVDYERIAKKYFRNVSNIKNNNQYKILKLEKPN